MSVSLTEMAGWIEVTGSCGRLCDSHRFHLQPDGSYQKDSAWPAVYLVGETLPCSMQMVVWKDGRPLQVFRVRLTKEELGEGLRVHHPSTQLQLEYELMSRPNEDDEESDADGCLFIIERVVLTE